MEYNSRQIRTEIGVFLILTLILSTASVLPIITLKTLDAQGGLFVLLLMWSPGVSALVTTRLFHHPLNSLGWRLGKPRYLLIGYLLPLLYGLAVYGLVWLSPWGALDRSAGFGPVRILISATLLVLISILSALGEEIGWRGFLVPRLAELMGFSRAALVSGIIWLVWHLPLVLLADYNNGMTPVGYAVVCFGIMVVGISFPFAWLRLKSGSLWPAVILHAAHNALIQELFDPMTQNTGITPYLIGEFGAGLALAGIVVGVLFWRKGRSDFQPHQATEPG